jgi:malate dehydrogenase (oxaloacetate-decarboxylating)(NADP+)
MKHEIWLSFSSFVCKENSSLRNTFYGAPINFDGLYYSFHPRLISVVAPAVCKAAMDSGVANPIMDLNKYEEEL